MVALQRRMSVYTVLYQQAVNEVLELNLTDGQCFNLLEVAGSELTAGELARLSGLTTGAITGVVDRLVAARLVKRVPDKHDRRKVIVALTHERDEEIARIYMGARSRIVALMSEQSEDGQQLINAYLQKAMMVLREEAIQLRKAHRSHG